MIRLSLGKQPVLDPVEVAHSLDEQGKPAPPDLQKANCLINPVGREPARGWLCMRRASLNALNVNGFLTLTFDDGKSTQTVTNLLISKEPQCLTVPNRTAYADDPLASYLLEVADARWLARNTYFQHVTTSQYNVRAPAYGGSSTVADLYCADTLNAGAVWTWSDMIGDLWGQLPPYFGDYPGLPFSPDGVPEGWAFPGMPVWDALCDALDRLQCVVVWKWTSYAIVRVGAADAASDAVLSRAAKRLIHDANYQPIAFGREPEKVRVLFNRREKYAGTEETNTRAAGAAWQPLTPHYVDVTGGINAATGTTHVLWDDLPAIYDETGSLVNGAALAARASERSADYYRALRAPGGQRLHKTYSGLLPLSPGSTVKAVAFRQRQVMPDGEGDMVTEVVRIPAMTVKIGDNGQLVEHDDASKPNQAPFFGPQWPTYPLTQQVLRINDSTPSAGLYDCYLEKPASSTTFTDKDAIWGKDLADSLSLTVGGRYLCRLVYFDSSRPVYAFRSASANEYITINGGLDIQGGLLVTPLGPPPPPAVTTSAGVTAFTYTATAVTPSGGETTPLSGVTVTGDYPNGITGTYTPGIYTAINIQRSVSGGTPQLIATIPTTTAGTYSLTDNDITPIGGSYPLTNQTATATIPLLTAFSQATMQLQAPVDATATQMGTTGGDTIVYSITAQVPGGAETTATTATVINANAAGPSLTNPVDLSWSIPNNLFSAQGQTITYIIRRVSSTIGGLPIGAIIATGVYQPGVTPTATDTGQPLLTAIASTAPTANGTGGTSAVQTFGLNVVATSNPGTAPTATVLTGSGTTTTYGFTYGGVTGQTTLSPLTTVSGGATPNNLVSAIPPPVPLTTFIYRTVGGSSQGIIASIPPGAPAYVLDNGLVADGSTAPSTNQTGGVNLGGAILPSTATVSDGDLLIGDAATNSFVVATPTGGTGITITPGAGSLTFTATGTGAPGGSQYDIQANDGSGGFHGDGNATWNYANQQLAIVGDGTHTTVDVSDGTYDVQLCNQTNPAAMAVTDGLNTALVCDGTYAFNATTGSVNSQAAYHIGGSAGVSGSSLESDTATGGLWTAIGVSDGRLKRDQQPLGPVLARLLQLHPVRFFWDTDLCGCIPGIAHDEQPQLGLLAEEIALLFPEAGQTGILASGIEVASYKATALRAILVAALQEEHALLEALAARVALLEGKK